MTNEQTSDVTGIIVAAGRSERMDGIDKVFTTLVGRPLIVWTLSAFQKCDVIDRIVVVAAPRSVMAMEALCREWRLTKVTDVVSGGATRQASVRAGLDAARGASIVAIHDGARPLVTPDLIARGIEIARETGAALCAVPARDTVKSARGEPPVVASTPDRRAMWLAQTPQVFSREVLVRAHERAEGDVTDDAMLVEATGHEVRIYEGLASNLKVTTAEDLIIAEALLRERLSAS